ncbi:hypothetical protein PMIN06_003262 [Paraphaeosphaeria minitans]
MLFNAETLFSVLHLLIPTAHASPARRPPAAKPLPPSKIPGTGEFSTPAIGDGKDGKVAYHKSCGLDIPTRAAWEMGQGKVFAEWWDVQWLGYLNDGNYKSLPLYLRDNFAPDAPPSTMACDGIGSCTIGSCLNLDKRLSIHDRQMAYYAFEQLATIAHYSEAQKQATISATNYQLGNMKANVEMFTSSKYIEHKLVDRMRQEAAAISAVTAIALVATGLMGATPLLGEAGVLGGSLGRVGVHVGQKTLNRVGTTNQVATLLSNSFIGLSGFAKSIREDPNLGQDLTQLMSLSWNKLAHEATDSIASDLADIMTGANNTQGQALPQLIKSGEFIEADPQIYMELSEIIEMYYQAAMINSLWKFERAYILDTNALNGNCHNDYRGASQVRVCLDEYPGHTYWLFSIDQSEEDDRQKNDQALVHGPIGYRNFFERKSSDMHNLSKEDIVRSSLWIDANNFEDKVNAEKLDLMLLMRSMLDANKYLGEVPGAFSVPICRNPGGEAISSVWEKKGRNYPCKCGEVPWKQKHYDPRNDRTRKFLERSGFKYSEDWEDYCSDHNSCHGEDSINWNFTPGPGGKKIPKKLKHPFKSCTDANKHGIGSPHKDYKAMKRGRGLEETTWQDVQRAQLELWAQQLEQRQAKQHRQREEYLEYLSAPESRLVEDRTSNMTV